MKNKNQAFIGIAIIIAGVVFLLGNLFNVDVGMFCFPVAIILLGVWLLVRPQMMEPGTELTQKLFGEVHRGGSWPVQDEEFWAFVMEYEFDFTKTDIPLGDSRLRANGFINECDLIVPADVGVSVTGSGFVSSLKVNGASEDSFLAPAKWETAAFKAADRRIHIDMNGFINEIKVRQI